MSSDLKCAGCARPRVGCRGTATERRCSVQREDICLSNSTGSTLTRSNLDDVQAHYDLSNEFFALFVDPTRTYSCAYFEREDMTLEEAQLAKLDLTLGKLGLEPGMTLLDVGCGWGSTMKRAIEKYDVNVVGLTLSQEPGTRYCQQLLDADRHEPLAPGPAARLGRVQRAGGPDRHPSSALEHFGFDRYDDFFKFAYEALPDDGVMLLHSITGLTRAAGHRARHAADVRAWPEFMKFIVTDIFPGGRLPTIETVEEHADEGGFQR